VKARIYVEGGGAGKLRSIECRTGFAKLFERAGLGGRMPRIVACGGRHEAYKRFCSELDHCAEGDFVAMLVDSEESVVDGERPWDHLQKRQGDEWSRPAGAEDEQALLMVTSMETWIVADPSTLEQHFGNAFVAGKLPHHDLESRNRHDVFRALQKATERCKVQYLKGSVSFVVLAKVNPSELRQKCSSFDRVVRILDERLVS